MAFRPVVVVLASGRGERFLASGGAVHKLKAPLAGKPLLEHTLAAVRASGLPLHVVAATVGGMGDSIAAGVRAMAGACGWLVLPADLPLILPQTILQMAAALEGRRVVVPVYHGARGHPVGFDAACGPDLVALRGDVGAVSVVRKHGAELIQVQDVGAVQDVDTVEQLLLAEKVLQARFPCGNLS